MSVKLICSDIFIIPYLHAVYSHRLQNPEYILKYHFDKRKLENIIIINRQVDFF